VLLHNSKGFDIKNKSYIESNFIINKCIPDVSGIKKKEINQKILFAVSSETVNKDSIIVRGIFQEMYDNMSKVEKIKLMEKRIEALEKKIGNGNFNELCKSLTKEDEVKTIEKNLEKRLEELEKENGEGIYYIYSRFPDGRYIYKIGMSKNLGHRLKQYPQNYQEVLSFQCNNPREMEKKLLISIGKMCTKDIKKCDQGIEYFESANNCVEIIKKNIINTVNEEGPIIKIPM
jgi:hypothetical protein